MNLADAIRRATHGEPETTGHAPAPALASFPVLAEPAPAAASKSFDISENESVPSESPMNELSQSEQLFDPSAGQNTVVRLELLLTPDQLSNLFRAVAANQHSLWTVRETASYLRINSHALEQMAQEAAIPAFRVNGKWRFAKTAVDEWLQTNQLFNQEAA